jgi:hypothetical protein
MNPDYYSAKFEHLETVKLYQPSKKHSASGGKSRKHKRRNKRRRSHKRKIYRRRR